MESGGNQITEQELKEITEKIFEKYDPLKSGALGPMEVTAMMQDAFSQSGRNRTFGEEQVRRFIRCIDLNGDGRVQPKELFRTLKHHILNH